MSNRESSENAQSVKKTGNLSTPQIKITKASDSSTGSSPVIVPTPATVDIEPDDEVAIMEAEAVSRESEQSGSAKMQKDEEPAPAGPSPGDDAPSSKQQGKGTRLKAKKGHKHAQKAKKPMSKKNKKKKKKHAIVEDSSSDSSSSSESESDASVESSSSDDESSEDEREKRKKSKQKKQKAKVKAKEKEKEKEKRREKKRAKLKGKIKALAKKRKSKKYISSSEDSDSDSDSDVSSASTSLSSYSSDSSDSSSSSSSSDSDPDSEEEKKRRKKKAKKAKMKKKGKETAPPPPATAPASTDTATTADPTPPPAEGTAEQLATKLEQIMNELKEVQKLGGSSTLSSSTSTGSSSSTTTTEAPKEEEDKSKKSKLEYKRVDHVWDRNIYDYKLVDSAEKTEDDYDCVFTVRRCFNYTYSGNHYTHTVIDVKASPLKKSLQEVFKGVPGLSLAEETPEIDPNVLFLYYDEIASYCKKTLKARAKKQKKKKQLKQLKLQIAQCKLLLGYIDKDYEAIRKRLTPMVKAGDITYDLIWALFKPKNIAYTPTMGNKDDPRAIKIEHCQKLTTWRNEEFWSIGGRYLEYDGKIFGLAPYYEKIDPFKGTKKIISLPIYPLSYHQEAESLRAELIERGKKFVALQGMNYRHYNGISYQIIKNKVKKHTVEGRVMIDPALFRRMNPNYSFETLKKEENGLDDEDQEEKEDADSDCCCDCDAESDCSETPSPRFHFSQEDSGSEEANRSTNRTFTSEQLLIASSVVLGFSFTVKQWMEFSVSNISDIKWNSSAFDTLVLPETTKANLKGLVLSHRFNAAKTVDDVIQGKGKGFNVVLHGPPGVGKTLTAESIADLLECPLYVVSAGELGTSSRDLEGNLNAIMDVTHSWGAILLLDEADVFLEQRQAQDIHRNALVSVFLRVLEYYQGILFLTTNRVNTFDEAFQSRIHMGIRYEELSPGARREIWMNYVGRVERLESGAEEGEKEEGGEKKTKKSQESSGSLLKEADYDYLSRKALNGRQIKNAVCKAQLIAMTEKKPFSMEYIRRYLDSQEQFNADMQGGHSHHGLYN